MCRRVGVPTGFLDQDGRKDLNLTPIWHKRVHTPPFHPNPPVDHIVMASSPVMYTVKNCTVLGQIWR